MGAKNESCLGSWNRLLRPYTCVNVLFELLEIFRVIKLSVQIIRLIYFRTGVYVFFD